MADVRGEGLPEVVSYFRVAELLGSGGMGAVYKGYDRRTDTPVAIKFLHAHLAEDPSFRERFEREAHVASLLTSPYTVHLQEAGMTGGRFYIVMEYVEGHTLKDALKEGSLPLSRALRIALQVSRALEAAHAQNIVHRDIKPENVFLSGEDSVKVGDFGIARQEGGATLTVTGAFIGTLTYAAPEQMLGKAGLRSDIYALGATLYHMLAGRPPFSGTIQEMLRLVPEVPPPREPLAGQPAAVVEIVLRSLAKDPDERQQTAAELSADIERASRPGAAVATEDQTIVDRPAEETAAATLLEETAPIVPSGRPSVAMTLGPPRTGSTMARLRSTRYDLTITNDGDAAAELELAATDEAGSCRFSLPRRISVAAGSAATLSMGVRPAARRWRGGQQTHRFTVSASGAGDGPPISVSGDFTDLPYGWLPFGGVLSVGGVAAVVAAVLLLGGGGGGGNTDPLRIGVLVPLSGNLSDFGDAFVNAAELAAAEINTAGGVLGDPVEIESGDSASDEQLAVAEARHLIDEDGVDAIIGAATSGVTVDVAEQVTGPASILQISPAAVAPDVTSADDGDFLFRTALSDSAQGVLLAQLAAEQGFGSVCSMYVDEPYGQAMNANLVESVASGVIVVEVPHQRNQSSYRDQIDLCAETDAIALLSFAEAGGELLLTEARAGGETNFLFSDGMRVPDTFANLGWFLLDGLQGTDMGASSFADDSFDAAYEAEYGEPPPALPFLRETYDAVYLIALAAEAAGSRHSPDIRDALRPVANPPGEAIQPGVEGFQRAKGLLGQGADINFQGLSGPADFDENGDVLSGSLAVWQVNAAAQELRNDRTVVVNLSTLTPMPTPTPSPAVDRIAFRSDRDGDPEIYVMNADGSDVTALTFDPAADFDPDWSPDGTRIAFSSNRSGNFDIWVMNAADGSDARELFASVGDDGDPHWSPDGGRIAFISKLDGNSEIYVMDADGSNLTNLTKNPGEDVTPTWSPDGARIAFASDRSGDFEIYIMNADGSDQTPLTDNSDFDNDPAWSPDGSLIAFFSDRDGNFEVYVMNADGSTQTRLTDDPAEDAFPAWSSDGSRIAFRANRDGNEEIYVMNPDGSGQSNLTDNPTNDNFPAWSP